MILVEERMARLPHGEIQRILHTPHLRKELMVRVIIATQAREGIVTTQEQAEMAYDKIQKELHAALQNRLGS